MTPSSSTLTRPLRTSRYRTCFRRIYIAAVRVDRRRSWRSAIDQSVSYFESNQDARLMDATFSQAYTLMSSAKARGLELGRSRMPSASVTGGIASDKAACSRGA